MEIDITTSKRSADDTIKYLTSNELQRLFKQIRAKRDVAIFRLAFHRGLRASEVGLLSLADLDRRDDEGHPAIFIHRLKGGKSGVFSLMPAELTSLRAWLRERGSEPGPLFPSRKRKPISQQMLDVLMKRYGGAAGIQREKQHFHVLRHTCATSLLDANQTLEYVMAHLGHRNIKNTQIYAQLSDRKQATVARGLRASDWGRA